MWLLENNYYRFHQNKTLVLDRLVSSWFVYLFAYFSFTVGDCQDQ